MPDLGAMGAMGGAGGDDEDEDDDEGGDDDMPALEGEDEAKDENAQPAAASSSKATATGNPKIQEVE